VKARLPLTVGIEVRARLALFAVSPLLVSVACAGCSGAPGDASGPSAASGSGTAPPPGAATSPTTSAKAPSGASLPLVTPPVRAVTLDSSDMKSRFFSEGPTSIFRLLTLIDGGITKVNARIASGEATCLAAPPIPNPGTSSPRAGCRRGPS